MHSLPAEFTPVDHPDPSVPTPDPASAPLRRPLRSEPARVIEVGEVTAGIAVPEGHGVRFFSSARVFDGLDGAVFRNAAQAARAARERLRRGRGA